MRFLNIVHEKKFFRLCEEFIPEEKLTDRAYKAFVFLISGDQALQVAVEPYLNDKGVFDYESMVQKEKLTADESVLVKLAALLLLDKPSFPFEEVFIHLEDDRLYLALAAAEYRFSKIDETTYRLSDTNSYLN